VEQTLLAPLHVIGKGEPMRIRHQYRTSQRVSTRHGAVVLDKQGYVTNMQDLPVTAEAMLKLPNFINGDLFAPPKEAKLVEPKKVEEPIKETPPPEEVPSGEPMPEPPIEATDEQYAAVISLMRGEGAPTSSEGFVDMEALNSRLKEMGYALLTGEKRKALETQLNAA